jgi:hypothetical protein
MTNLKKSEFTILLFIAHFTENKQDKHCTFGPAFRTYNSEEERFRYRENIMDEFVPFENNYYDTELKELFIQF